jgi:hypothetical protein
MMRVICLGVRVQTSVPKPSSGIYSPTTLIGIAAARAATAKMLSSDINASLVEHRMMTAMVATPPETPITMGVTVDMSRTGAPHRVWVMFCVAISVSLQHTQLPGFNTNPDHRLHCM